MDVLVTGNLISALKKKTSSRTQEDLNLLASFVQRFISPISTSALHSLCRDIRYERHNTETVLYRLNDFADCWYILLSGSVFIDGYTFHTADSFGKRSRGCSHRVNNCLVLEQSEMMVIQYPQSVIDQMNGSKDEIWIPPVDYEDQEDDLSLLQESFVDSDSEDAGNDSFNSFIVKDAVRECLEKDAKDRTEEDIEMLMDFMQHLPAFNNMTVATRRAMCGKVLFAVVEKEGTVIFRDGEELDAWSVIINGCVEVVESDGRIQQVMQMGDSFGLEPTMKKLHHSGWMKSKVDNCQFVCIMKEDYYNILHQGVQNTERLRGEQGETVLVTEKRAIKKGNRVGQVVIRGTAEKLLSYLVDEHSTEDPTYVEDFLLTSRAFLTSRQDLTGRLIEWFEGAQFRQKAVKIVLLWVNNHLRDFEEEFEMNEFLTKFMSLLEEHNMNGHLDLLYRACSTKSHPRTVCLRRHSSDVPWSFRLFGGSNKAGAIFVECAPTSAVGNNEIGLVRGDQILDVNGLGFESISLDTAKDILNQLTQIQLTVKYNFVDFREATSVNDGDGKAMHGKGVFYLCEEYDNQAGKKKDASASKKLTKVFEPFLKKMILHSGSQSNLTTSPTLSGDLNSIPASPIRSLHSSSSHPDLTSLQLKDNNDNTPSQLLKIYNKADNNSRILMISKSVVLSLKEMSVRDVIVMALKEFGIQDSDRSYSLLESTMDGDHVIRQSKLPGGIHDLSTKSSANSRLYLVNNQCSENYVRNETSADALHESRIMLLNLHPQDVAVQLCERDFQLFRDIEQTEYVDDLFGCKSKFGTRNLTRFTNLVNEEMFWVITEICSEQNIDNRMKIIQCFLKVAKHCKELNNFNSMFSIISGLSHGSVSRLKQTWERLPAKYLKLFKNLQDLMDPSRNMSKYRNLLNVQLTQCPAIPFFPIVKKDLTFIHLGNDTIVEGLINFEKMRMLAKEIRHVTNMAAPYYHKQNLESSPSVQPFSSANVPAFATLRKKKTTVANKRFEEEKIAVRAKKYLDNLCVMYDEARLNEMSCQLESSVNSNAKKHDSSPLPTNSSNPLSDSRPASNTSKFGTDSNKAVQKLLGLTEKVKPHDQKKNPVPSMQLEHDLLMRRQPKKSKPRPLPAVRLSSESSSIAAPNVNKHIGSDHHQSASSKYSQRHTESDTVSIQSRLSSSSSGGGSVRLSDTWNNQRFESTKHTTDHTDVNDQSSLSSNARWPLSAPVSPRHSIPFSSPHKNISNKPHHRIHSQDSTTQDRTKDLDDPNDEEFIISMV